MAHEAVTAGRDAQKERFVISRKNADFVNPLPIAIIAPGRSNKKVSEISAKSPDHRANILVSESIITALNWVPNLGFLKNFPRLLVNH